jgi:L-ascorbate metabolism protein UlaG (beta-lactamase superfamily)
MESGRPELPTSLFNPAPFDGRRFSNISGDRPHSTFTVLRWLITRQRPRWPDFIASDPVPKPVERVDDGAIRATTVGHATVLLQVAGLNLLTDPVWSQRVGPLPWLGVKRVRPPAIAFDDLPKIDAVLLSHNHYDHLDRPTLTLLERRDSPLILTGKKVGKFVPSRRVVELDWWETHKISNHVRATYVPAEHFSLRRPLDRNVTLWGGFVVETPAGVIYFSGDTGDGLHFAAIRERFGPVTLSLIPIGAYAPRWFMAPVHIDPAEAVAAGRTVESQVSLAIHFGTFLLGDDAFDAPPLALAAALAELRNTNHELDFRVPGFGEPVVVRSERAVRRY